MYKIFSTTFHPPFLPTKIYIITHDRLTYVSVEDCWNKFEESLVNVNFINDTGELAVNALKGPIEECPTKRWGV